MKAETEEVIPAEAGPASGISPCVWIKSETKWIKVPAAWFPCAPPAGGICIHAEQPLGRQEREDPCGMKFFGNRGASGAGLSKSSIIPNRQGGDGPALPQQKEPEHLVPSLRPRLNRS